MIKRGYMRNYERFCPEHYTEIENYYEALKDDFKGWDCHHRNGEEFSVDWLIKNNMYFNRSDPHEFKFMREKDHISLHKKYKGYCVSEFGFKFKEHFNLSITEIIPVELRQTYKNEHKIYKRNGVCRWEKEYKRTAWNKGMKSKK